MGERKKRIRIPYLEMHVTHACNLACDGCSHYSNRLTKGMVSLDDAGGWMAKWEPRVEVLQFGLLGGEPTLHPQLVSFFPLVRSYWPNAKLILKTNGLHLDRHPDLESTLREVGARVVISQHGRSPEYLARFTRALQTVESWRGVPLEINDLTYGWTDRYQTIGKKMLPFAEGHPEKSWKTCISKYCVTLFRGRLWKCPAIAYLQLLKDDPQIATDWSSYLTYEGITADVSDAQLSDFLSRKSEAICAMCPTRKIIVEKKDPLRRSLSTEVTV